MVGGSPCATALCPEECPNLCDELRLSRLMMAACDSRTVPAEIVSAQNSAVATAILCKLYVPQSVCLKADVVITAHAKEHVALLAARAHAAPMLGCTQVRCKVSPIEVQRCYNVAKERTAGSSIVASSSAPLLELQHTAQHPEVLLDWRQRIVRAWHLNIFNITLLRLLFLMPCFVVRTGFGFIC